ncbi:MAG: hypothetical protein WDA07_08195 [Leucobacter sp.]
MVNIRSTRMRTVSEARDTFNALVGDAQVGILTHVVKGSDVAAHIIPPTSLLLDDQQLRTAMINTLVEVEASEATSEFREGVFYQAGDTIGRLLGWCWRSTDRHLFLSTMALYHAKLQHAVDAAISIPTLIEGLQPALSVTLSADEIADLLRVLTQEYDEYHPPY